MIDVPLPMYRRLCWTLFAVTLVSLGITAISVAASFGRAPVPADWLVRYALFAGALLPQVAYLLSQSQVAFRAPVMLWRREDAWLQILFTGIILCFVSALHRGAPWYSSTFLLPLVFLFFTAVLFVARTLQVSAALRTTT